jgi:hypothetical protein
MVRRQVLVLRESRRTHPGTGWRLLTLECGSLTEFDPIEQNLVGRRAFVRRDRTKTWEVDSRLVTGGIEVSVLASSDGPPFRPRIGAILTAWSTLSVPNEISDTRVSL